MTELLDRSERLTRNAIATIRPGTYVSRITSMTTVSTVKPWFASGPA